MKYSDISEADLNDPYWYDQVKVLAGGDMILIGEVKKAFEGEEFFYFEKVGEGRKIAEAVSPEAWEYYYRVFALYRRFGLPHASGWANELPWVIQFLDYMDSIREIIEYDAKLKAANN